MVNRVTLIGYAGRDPELRYTKAGKAVANLSVATSERWKNDRGEPQEKTEWHRLVVWGATAEKFVGPYVRKGDLLYVEGRLQTSEYDDARTGEKRRSTEVVVDEIRKLNRSAADRTESGGDDSPRDIRHERQRDRDAYDDMSPEMRAHIEGNTSSDGKSRLF